MDLCRKREVRGHPSARRHRSRREAAGPEAGSDASLRPINLWNPHLRRIEHPSAGVFALTGYLEHLAQTLLRVNLEAAGRPSRDVHRDDVVEPQHGRYFATSFQLVAAGGEPGPHPPMGSGGRSMEDRLVSG